MPINRYEKYEEEERIAEQQASDEEVDDYQFTGSKPREREGRADGKAAMDVISVPFKAAAWLVRGLVGGVSEVADAAYNPNGKRGVERSRENRAKQAYRDALQDDE